VADPPLPNLLVPMVELLQVQEIPAVVLKMELLKILKELPLRFIAWVAAFDAGSDSNSSLLIIADSGGRPSAGVDEEVVSSRRRV